jgi:small subunit ribosomal protein S17
VTSKRQKKIGVVTSNSMKKTIIVRVDWRAMDSKYKKYVKKQTKLYVHDERGESQIGDRVEVVETRPLSKLKRWRILRKL